MKAHGGHENSKTICYGKQKAGIYFEKDTGLLPEEWQLFFDQ